MYILCVHNCIYGSCVDVWDNSICVQHRVVAMFISDRQSFGKFEPSSGGPFHPVSSDTLPLPHPGQRMFGFKKVAFCFCVSSVCRLCRCRPPSNLIAGRSFLAVFSREIFGVFEEFLAIFEQLFG